MQLTYVLWLIFVTRVASLKNTLPNKFRRSKTALSTLLIQKPGEAESQPDGENEDDVEQSERPLKKLASLFHELPDYIQDEDANYNSSSEKGSTNSEESGNDDDSLSFFRLRKFPVNPSSSLIQLLGDPTGPKESRGTSRQEYNRAAQRVVKYLDPTANLTATTGQTGLDVDLDMVKGNLQDAQKQMAEINHMLKEKPGPGKEVRELNHERRWCYSYHQ